MKKPLNVFPKTNRTYVSPMYDFVLRKCWPWRCRAFLLRPEPSKQALKALCGGRFGAMFRAIPSEPSHVQSSFQEIYLGSPCFRQMVLGFLHVFWLRCETWRSGGQDLRWRICEFG